MRAAHAEHLRGVSHCMMSIFRGSHCPLAKAATAVLFAGSPTLYACGRRLSASVEDSTGVRGLYNGSSRPTGFLSSVIEGRQLSNCADAAAAKNTTEKTSGAAHPKIQCFSDLLEQDDPLSGLFDSYNTEKSLGSLLTRSQMERRLARALRVEKERAERSGLGPAGCRQFSFKDFVPSFAVRLPFEDRRMARRPQATNYDEGLTANAGKTNILQHIPLSNAIKAILSGSAAMYVDRNRFRDALEPLVYRKGDLGGVPDSVNRAEVRGILEDVFTKMPTTHSGLADAFDLILGLCQICQTTESERMRATFVLFDTEGQGCLNFLLVAAVFHHLHRMLLTPSVVDMFHRAQVTFQSVDDLAVASTVELFKGKYPHITNSSEETSMDSFAPATTGTAAAAAAACARDQLFIDLTEEPWKSAACHSDLFLTYEDFVRVCEATPKVVTMSTESLLRLPLIVTLQDLVDV